MASFRDFSGQDGARADRESAPAASRSGAARSGAARSGAPVKSPMEAALAAMTQGKALMRRRIIRANAHRYERGVLRAWFRLPEPWFQAHGRADPLIGRAIIRRLRSALIRDRRLRGHFLRRTACPFDRETVLWGYLGGELLNLGRHVKKPEDIP